MRYKLPAERSVRIFTLAMFLIPFILFFSFYALDMPLVGIITGIPILIVSAVTYAYAPKEVILEKNAVVIKRVLGQVVIPYGKIREVSFFEKLNWKSIRIFGSGGLCGWFGLFHVPDVGEVWIYARRRRDLVLIKADKNYLIAPENPGDFILNLRRLLSTK